MQVSSPLFNKKIYSVNKYKKLGWIRGYVFSDLSDDFEIARQQILNKEYVGYFIKRPDLLWMFHRSPGYVLKEDLVQDENKLYTVAHKSKIKKANDCVKNKALNSEGKNIRWKDCKIVDLKSVKEEAAKIALKKAPDTIKTGAKVAGHVAADNIEAHSQSLKNMFSEFKEEYKKGREE